MAMVAVLLAVATLLGHRAHTEEILLQTQNVDDWNFYQAKHTRAYEFALAAKDDLLLPNGRDSAIENLQSSMDEECGVPAEKNCTSPLLKKSKILQQLAADLKKPPEKPEGTNEAGHSSPAAPAVTESKSGSVHHEAGKAEKSGGKEGEGFKEGALQIQERAREGEKETRLVQHKANYYDGGELFLELSIVLCSISLLSANKLYWKFSFVSTAVGVAFVAWSMLLH